jgi:hypothetical protein
MNSILPYSGEMPEKQTFDPKAKSRRKFIKTEKNPLKTHFLVNCPKYSKQ